MVARIRLAAYLFILTMVLSTSIASAQQGQTVYIAEVDGVINPPAAGYIARAIQEAEREGGQALVLLLNTPGGLTSSTWEIGEAMLNASIPVIVYVSPEGAYAGSAGVFICYAGHITAMAPNTNIGAAHPVSGEGQDLGDDIRDKVTNDAVAKITTWARSRGRNAEWAEKAVRESVSIGSDEALKLNVINLVARDLDDLLRQLDGREVQLSRGPVVLSTAGAPTERIEMSLVEQLLHLVADPNIATILMSLGMMALYFELANPGLTVAGLLGAIAILLGLYGINVLPVNYTGLALLVFAFILFGVDIFATNHGALTLGGIVAFVIGALLLFNNNEAPGVQVSRWLIAGMALGLGIISGLMIYLVLRIRGKRVVTGESGLIGMTAEVRAPLMPEGSVFVDGAIWKARAEQPLENTRQVEVVGVDGLTLLVRPLAALDGPVVAPAPQLHPLD